MEENDWKACLVHISYPQGWFNWSSQESLDYPFVDFTMSSGKETFPFYLLPSNYKTLKEVREAIAIGIFKKRSELLLQPENVETIYDKNHFVHIKTLSKEKEYNFDTLELWTPPIYLANLLGLTKPSAGDVNDYKALGQNLVL